MRRRSQDLTFARGRRANQTILCVYRDVSYICVSRLDKSISLSGSDPRIFSGIFSEPDVRALIREIRPDIHAKGTDYTAESVPERDVVIENGGRVEIVGDPKNHSSSEIIRSRFGSPHK